MVGTQEIFVEWEDIIFLDAWMVLCHMKLPLLFWVFVSLIGLISQLPTRTELAWGLTTSWESDLQFKIPDRRRALLRRLQNLVEITCPVRAYLAPIGVYILCYVTLCHVKNTVSQYFIYKSISFALWTSEDKSSAPTVPGT